MTDSVYQRQLDLLPPSKSEKESITVLGAGATGSFLVFLLTKMGFKDITVYDKDVVELHNLPNQMFPVVALGQNKALALQEVVQWFNAIKIKVIPEYWNNEPLSGIVVSAVDSMKVRKEVFENCVKNQVKLLIDPRAGAQVARVFTIDPTLSYDQKYWLEHWFDDELANPVPCTAGNIAFSPSLIASLIANQIKRYVMIEEYKREVYLDMTEHYAYAK